MHPVIMAELAEARGRELRCEAQRARLASTIKTYRKHPGGWRERTGGLLISAGTALAGRAH